MKDPQNFLFIVQGHATKWDVLEYFTKLLDERVFPILYMHFLNCQSALYMLIPIEVSDSKDKDSLGKELDKSTKIYRLELLIRPLPEMTIGSPVHRYILTFLRKQLRKEFFTKLIRHLRVEYLQVF